MTSTETVLGHKLQTNSGRLVSPDLRDKSLTYLAAVDSRTRKQGKILCTVPFEWPRLHPPDTYVSAPFTSRKASRPYSNIEPRQQPSPHDMHLLHFCLLFEITGFSKHVAAFTPNLMPSHACQAAHHPRFVYHR